MIPVLLISLSACAAQGISDPDAAAAIVPFGEIGDPDVYMHSCSTIDCFEPDEVRSLPDNGRVCEWRCVDYLDRAAAHVVVTFVQEEHGCYQASAVVDDGFCD